MVSSRLLTGVPVGWAALHGLAGYDDPGSWPRTLCATLPIVGVIRSRCYIEIETTQGPRRELDSAPRS